MSLRMAQRVARYLRQNGTAILTPRQQRRIWHKDNRALRREAQTKGTIMTEPETPETIEETEEAPATSDEVASPDEPE